MAELVGTGHLVDEWVEKGALMVGLENLVEG